jgi:hypothetical protein
LLLSGESHEVCEVDLERRAELAERVPREVLAATVDAGNRSPVNAWDEGPLSPFQVSVRIGDSAQAVRYWAKLLDTFDLVEVHDGPDGGEPLYSATLAGQPDWV